jgi:hypothetical protein
LGTLLAVLAALPAAGAQPPAGSSAESTWVSVSYRDLLDPEVVTHSGAKLVDARLRKASRGEVQPFLDPYSSLLGYAVQMLSGADPVPQVSLVERYPPGSAQPAWAALLREGKYFVSTDGRGRARVFVPGDDPRDAYRRAASLLRHPLAAALVPGSPLQVEVFAYRNDFAAAELRLNPAPYRFRARSFPPRGRPLDLAGLEAFFRQGGQLEGAELEPGGGLVLYASKAQRQTLAGEAVSLADLAVAYRAVFHAGDAEAFVSLDRNADPTLATVNFGGLLEDTRIGTAVLAADLRFKTICSGLDPVTHEDIREKTRGAVPSFMSNSERHFIAGPAADLAQWVVARYWYYPDSCGVESDEDDRLAAITKTQLTADVERVDAGTAARRGGKAALPAVFRENIRDLNRTYARYAALFPEFNDLSSAARLMALAAWLGRVRPEWLDLDGLLAVTLPPQSTPRTIPQLLSAEILQLPGTGTGPPDRGYVLRNTRVQYLTPEVDKRVSEFFGEPRHLAVFLAFKAGKEPDRAPEFAAEAERLFPTVREKRVRELLRTPGDLHAFLRFFAVRLIGEMSGASPAVSASDRSRLEAVIAELGALPPSPPGGPEDPRRLSLEQELQDFMRLYHGQGRGAAPAVVVTTQYTGGVSLSPRLFSVKKSATRPALEKLKAASRTAGTAWGTAGWIRSAGPAAGAGVSQAPAAAATPTAPAASSARPLPGRAPRPATGRTAPQVTPAGDALEEVASAPAPAAPSLSSIAVPGSATPAGSPRVGRLGDGRRIVFTRAR